MSAGGSHSLCIEASGAVLTWGHGGAGRLGHGDVPLTANPSPNPNPNQALNQERQEKLALRKQLGQSPPKKGQGKRASKKK